MHRIDTATAEPDLHGSGKDGFRDGQTPATTAATRLNADWCNAVQEEIANAVEAAGITLAKGTNTQLRDAVRNLSPWARYIVSGTSNKVTHPTTVSTPFGLTLVDSDDSAWGLASDVITVPVAGIYLVNVGLTCTSDDTTNPNQVALVLSAAGTDYLIKSMRYSAVAADNITVFGSALIEISGTLSITNSNVSNGNITVNGANTGYRGGFLDLRLVGLT